MCRNLFPQVLTFHSLHLFHAFHFYSCSPSPFPALTSFGRCPFLLYSFATPSLLLRYS